MKESRLRVRIKERDEVPGTLVKGLKILELFYDAIIEILVGSSESATKFDASDASFPGLVRSGEYLEIAAVLVRAENDVMQFDCTAHKVIAWHADRGDYIKLDEPELVATGSVLVRAATI